MSAKDLPQLRGTVSEKRADHKYRNKCSLGAVKRINFELRPPPFSKMGSPNCSALDEAAV